MSFLVQAILKDLFRWRQDTTAVLIWLAIPFLIGGLMTMLMSDDRARPRGVLLLVDQDNSLLSGLVAGAYTQGELGEILVVEKVSLDDGNRRIDAGDASGLLVIPEGFSDAFFESSPVTLTLKTNPSQAILPGIISDVTGLLIDAGFYVQQLFGDEIQALRAADSGPGSEAGNALVAAVAVGIRQKIEAAAPYLFPPAFGIRTIEPPDDVPGPSIALLFLPGIVLMAVMFAAHGLAADFWVERELGTLRRLLLSPDGLLAFVAAKSLAAAMIITGIGALALVAGFLYHGISWDHLLPSVTWIAASGVALFTWFSVLSMIGSTRRAANIVTSMVLFPMLMAGGSFFPLAALPEWIAALGRNTPNGFVADRLTSEIAGNAAWSIDPQSWLIIVILAISGVAVCAWRLTSGFARA